MLIQELFNLVFLSLAFFAALGSFFSLLLLGRLFFSSFLFLLLIEICCFCGDIAELMHLHEFFYPFSPLVKHKLLDTWFLNPPDLLFQVTSLRLELFLS